MSGIVPLVMPKWGLEMREGTLTHWLVAEGTEIRVGMAIAEVETDKISNAVEAPDAGILRRRVAKEGEVLPVKALLAVLAPPEVRDADELHDDAFIADVQRDVKAAAQALRSNKLPPRPHKKTCGQCDYCKLCSAAVVN